VQFVEDIFFERKVKPIGIVPAKPAIYNLRWSVDTLWLEPGHRIGSFLLVVQAVPVERSSSNVFNEGVKVSASDGLHENFSVGGSETRISTLLARGAQTPSTLLERLCLGSRCFCRWPRFDRILDPVPEQEGIANVADGAGQESSLARLRCVYRMRDEVYTGWRRVSLTTYKCRSGSSSTSSVALRSLDTFLASRSSDFVTNSLEPSPTARARLRTIPPKRMPKAS
jgi:hypothetical protein